MRFLLKHVWTIILFSCFLVDLTAQGFGIKRAIRKGPDICGVYTSTARYSSGPTGSIMAKEAKEWLEKKGYERVLTLGRMEHVQFVKKESDRFGYRNKCQNLKQLGSCRLEEGPISDKNLAYHKSLGYQLITASSKELKGISKFYYRQTKKNPNWQLGHFMYAAVNRKMDPIVMSGQLSAELKRKFLHYRYMQLGTYLCFKSIDFTTYNPTDWDEKMLDFFINSEILYYNAEFLKANSVLKNDKFVAEDYLQKVKELELQLYYLNENSPKKMNGQVLERWFKYIDHFRNVYREKDNTGLIVGTLLLAGVVAEGGKWLLEEGAKAGAFDDKESSTSGGSATDQSNCMISTKRTDKTARVEGEKYAVIKVDCNGFSFYDREMYYRSEGNLVEREGYYQNDLIGPDTFLAKTKEEALNVICDCDGK